MNVNNNVLLSIKVSFYSSYEDFQKTGFFGYWPFFACMIATIISMIVTADSVLTGLLAALTIASMIVSLVITRFYANSIISLSKEGIALNGSNVIQWPWTTVAHVAFLLPERGSPHLFIVLAIHLKDGQVKYIFVESLYFHTASSRIKPLTAIIKQYLPDQNLEIQKSNFQMIHLKEDVEPPVIRH